MPITDPAKYKYETFKITYECKDTTIINKKTNKKKMFMQSINLRVNGMDQNGTIRVMIKLLKKN